MRASDSKRMAELLTAWLDHRRLPDEMSESWTVLIPKEGANPENLAKWRPISVGNVLGRIFTNILRLRMEPQVPLCEPQRGFRSCPGLEENLFLLNRVLQGGNSEMGCTAIVVLDFEKAFDSVGHPHILAALRRFNMCSAVVEIVRNLYAGATTRLQIGGQYSAPIEFLRGVKQGDPLSSLLFNIAVDPLICSLQDSNAGVIPRGAHTRLGSLGYADDLIGLAHGIEMMD